MNLRNAYRKISINGIELRAAGVNPYQKVELRTVPDKATNLAESASGIKAD
jgi:hypothetical protein